MSVWKVRWPARRRAVEDDYDRSGDTDLSGNHSSRIVSGSDATARVMSSAGVRAREPSRPVVLPRSVRRCARHRVNDAITHERLTTKQASCYLGLSARTLERWRVEGTGPKYHKLGPGRRSRVVYLISCLDAWVEQQAYRSTSEY